jgi:hypothetical protein
MDITFIIVCLILVGSVFVPYYLFHAVGKKESKKIRTCIKEIVTKKNLDIYDSENWRSTYIGIDKTNGKMIFLKLMQPENSIQLLDLFRIKECEIVERRKVVKVNDKKERKLEKLDLKVTLIDGEILLLNFYDNSQYDIEDFELHRIEKWKSILSVISRNIPIKGVA